MKSASPPYFFEQVIESDICFAWLLVVELDLYIKYIK